MCLFCFCSSRKCQRFLCDESFQPTKSAHIKFIYSAIILCEKGKKQHFYQTIHLLALLLSIRSSSDWLHCVWDVPVHYHFVVPFFDHNKLTIFIRAILRLRLDEIRFSTNKLRYIFSHEITYWRWIIQKNITKTVNNLFEWWIIKIETEHCALRTHNNEKLILTSVCKHSDDVSATPVYFFPLCGTASASIIARHLQIRRMSDDGKRTSPKFASHRAQCMRMYSLLL